MILSSGGGAAKNQDFYDVVELKDVKNTKIPGVTVNQVCDGGSVKSPLGE